MSTIRDTSWRVGFPTLYRFLLLADPHHLDPFSPKEDAYGSHKGSGAPPEPALP